MTSRDHRRRLDALARRWDVLVDATSETDTSLVAFGTQGASPVVLKVVKREGDEWFSGEVLAAFDGRGAVRVYQHEPGAALVERAIPGDSLVEVSVEDDGRATAILAAVIEQLDGRQPTRTCTPVSDLAASFDAWLARASGAIPLDLVRDARRVFVELAASQGRTVLLHGDLQHANVVSDARRGWLAVDPKGLVGELEYEIGAALRNPHDRPELFASVPIIERRLQTLTATLNVNRDRTLRWSYAQAVLSTIWRVEDGETVETADAVVSLARQLRRTFRA